MKRIFVALTALLLAACSNNDTEENVGPGRKEDPKDRTVRIFAPSIDGQTGIVPLTAIQDDGLNLKWLKGDRIGVVMHDGTSLCADIYEAEAVGRVTGKTEFTGTLAFEETGAVHTFYGYYPELSDTAADDPGRIPVTVPSEQVQKGASADHLAELGLLAAEPVKVTGPADPSEPTPAVDMCFYRVLSTLEIRLAAYRTAGMELQSVSVLAPQGAPALAVSGATMDITRSLDSDFGVLNGGTASSSATLTVEGTVLLPVSQEKTFPDAPGTVADPSKVFSAWLTVCPGDFSGHDLTFRITTNKGLFTFTVPGQKLERGQKYVPVFVLGEDEPDDTVWDGSVSEPKTMDHAAKTLSIAKASELAWLAGAVNGTVGENVPDPTFAGYEITLTADLDLGGTVGWTPIGKSSQTPFCGNFHGAGHAVSNIRFQTGTGNNAAGLFGFVNGADPEHPGLLEDVKVTAFNTMQELDGILYFGGICAHATNVEFRSCEADVQVKDAAVQNVRYGGIVGQTKSVTVVSDCRSCGSFAVSGGANTGGLVGGIVGSMEDGSELSSLKGCRSEAVFTATPGAVIVGGICGQVKNPVSNSLFSGTIDGAADAGGICGMVGTPTVVVTACRNAGIVRGIRAGGIVGQVKKNSYKVDILACYNTGAVTGIVEVSGGTANSYAGGILAWHRGSLAGSVKACYNAGKVEGPGTIGSIYANRNKATVNDCYVVEKSGADASDANVVRFGDGTSETGWPAASDAGWGTAEGSGTPGDGNYWKPYTRFSSVYPVLWWEDAE